MKKWIKYGLSATMVLAAAMMLCSCKALDKLKWDHAVYTTDSINTIEFRGKTYEMIDQNQFDEKNYSPILEGAEVGRVTDSDVPVLLSVGAGETIYFKTDKEEEAPLFFTKEVAGNTGFAITRFYCVKDAIPDFEKMLKEAKMDRFYLTEGGWSEADELYVEENKLFDEASSNAILQTIKRPFNKKTDYMSWKEIENLSPKYLQPEFCDKNRLFTNNESVQIVRTKGEKHTYYIGVCNDSSERWYDDSGAFKNADWKRVSDSDVKIIEPLFTEYNEVMEFCFDESDIA